MSELNIAQLLGTEYNFRQILDMYMYIYIYSKSTQKMTQKIRLPTFLLKKMHELLAVGAAIPRNMAGDKCNVDCAPQNKSCSITN